MNQDEQAIRDLIAAWLEASAAGDTERVLGLMAEDAVFLMPGQDPMRGKAAFAASQDVLKGFALKAHSEVQEVKVLGDWAYCWTRLEVTVTPPGGAAPVRRAGHTLSILQKQHGAWLFVRDANMLAAAR